MVDAAGLHLSAQEPLEKTEGYLLDFMHVTTSNERIFEEKQQESQLFSALRPL